jgi:hypothetical protein
VVRRFIFEIADALLCLCRKICAPNWGRVLAYFPYSEKVKIGL